MTWYKFNPFRSFRRAAYLTLAMFVMSPAARPSQSAEPAATRQLERLVARASQGRHYETPSEADLRAAQLLFTRTFWATEPDDELRRAWATMHFELLTDVLPNDDVWVLREDPAAPASGRGFYAFRRNADLAIALQAPHSFFDARSREIVARMFSEGHIAAAAWNTVRRSVADIAHLDDCYMNAFTRAFSEAHGAGMVVQVHGYGRTKRRSTAGATADLIISSGTRSPAPWFRSASADFQRNFSFGLTRIYPWDVEELGGTTNKQGAIVRSAQDDAFVHVELSKGVRSRLLLEQSVRLELLKCLSELFRHFQSYR